MSSRSAAPRRGWSLRATSWSGALVLVLAATAVPWIVQAVNADESYRLNRFGVRPRRVDGLWGVVTQPFLHQSWGQLVSLTVPLLALGWVLMLSGPRVFGFVTAVVVVGGGALTWLIGPSGVVVVGAGELVFGWLGYLLARAVFSRRLKFVLVAVMVLLFFGTLLATVLPGTDGGILWQARLAGLVAGVGCGWLLHRRVPPPPAVSGTAPWRARIPLRRP